MSHMIAPVLLTHHTVTWHLHPCRYTEADLPRPITRKEDIGTLTGIKEYEKEQGSAKRAKLAAAAEAPAGAVEDHEASTKLSANGIKVAAVSRAEVNTDGESLVM